MNARNKIQVFIFLFFSCFLLTDTYSIAEILQSHHKQAETNLQFGRIVYDPASINNSYAEFPDNDISFDAYSRITKGERDIPDDPLSENNFHRILHEYSNLTGNIKLDYLNIDNLDLPPPFLSCAARKAQH
jgi:hypothetical protein